MLFGTKEATEEANYVASHYVTQARRKRRQAVKPAPKPREFRKPALNALEGAKKAGIEADWDLAPTYSQSRPAILGRWVVWHVLYESGISKLQCGRMTGGHDHATVINGLAKVRDHFSETELNTACLIANLPRRVGQGRLA